jgi:hypothetical protein
MSQPQIVHFLLVPDSGASRRLRRELASSEATVGVVVGVWQELVTLALDNFVVSQPDNSWSETFHAALKFHPDAFWAASYENSPDETSGVISRAYTQLLQETDPRKSFAPLSTFELPGRGGNHLRDLASLHESLAGALPGDLAAIQLMLDMAADEGIRQICVYSTDGYPRLSVWQAALIDHLNGQTTQ